MRAIYSIVILLITLGVNTSCETEIDVDYNNIESLYVVNSSTSDSGSSVVITRTTDMDASMDVTPVEAGSVVITDGEGNTYPLSRNEEGSYISTDVVAQSPGESYKLTINIEGEEFVSQSTVEPTMTIQSMEFVEEKIMSKKTLLAKLELERDAVVTRYYKYDLFLNGERLVWGTGRKDVAMPNPFTVSIMFAMEDDNGVIVAHNDDETPIKSGDVIEVSVTSLDKRGYEYFETLSLSSQSNSNPVYNFSGGCLGYYIAYLNNSVSKSIEL